MPRLKKSEIDYLLYAVTDFKSYPEKDGILSVRQALAGGASVIQLREKHSSPEATAALAEKIMPLCREKNALFVINDDVEAALLCDADGVHVGQGDMPLVEVRKLLGKEKIIGVSVVTPEQAIQACRDGADYLGAGAVFPTSTKLDADYVPYDVLKEICRVSTVPVVAIGGINLFNVKQLKGSGMAGAAVVSAIFGAPDIEEAARLLRKELSETV